jgi:hypothetical protein
MEYKVTSSKCDQASPRLMGEAEHAWFGTKQSVIDFVAQCDGSISLVQLQLQSRALQV